jgi:hypothetical protein
MAEQAERICELAHKVAAADDADTALRALTELRAEVDGFVRVQAGRALAAGHSFSDVARTMGISRQAAHRRFRDLAPERPRDHTRPLVATWAARHAVRLAQAEAYAAGANPGGEHVLLGILRTDCEAARTLRFEGVTPERARACLQTSARDDDDAESMHHILKLAGRIALSRGDHELDLEELLLAVLADPEGGASRTLAGLDVHPASVHDRFAG